MASPLSRRLSIGDARIHVNEWIDAAANSREPKLRAGSSDRSSARCPDAAADSAEPRLDPVVLLHGFTGSAEAMSGLAEGLRNAYRVLAIDLPGHGKTEIPQSALRGFSMASTVSCLWDALDELGAERANLVGYSMGGRVALSAAVACPKRAASVVCLGASPGIADPIERSERREADEALASSILSDGVEQFVDSWLAQPLFASLASRLSPADLRTSRQQRLTNTAEGLAFSLRSIGTGSMKPLHDALADAEFPCLWVAGSEDAKFAAIAEEMSATMPNGRCALVSDAGHSVHLENPAATLSAINDFLSEHNEMLVTA